MNIFGKFIKDATTTFIKNKPAIMTGIALVSFATTVFIAATEGPKIKAVADEKKEHIDAINANEEMSEPEKESAIRDEVTDGLKEVAMPVAKIAIASGITMFAILGINKAHTAREIAASALLESYKNQIVGYEEKVPAIIGKQKAEELRHDVIIESADKMCEQNGTNKDEFKKITYVDKVPFRDDFGNRWTASLDEFDRSINRMERDKNINGNRHPVNYADFLEDNFDMVELTPASRYMCFDPWDEAIVETSSYDDKFLGTIGRHVHFRYGGPVDEKVVEAKC